ncbi:MAG: hypothetical protein U5N85_01410 [Arcicella sp.]|nr:hypothetical protein [Arcicella sp.]
MIITFNKTVFQTSDPTTQKNLASILVEVSKRNHFLDLRDISDLFFEAEKFIFSESEIAKNYLSKSDRIDLQSFINSVILKSSYITQLHKKHLTKIIIGADEGEINPSDALRIITERSKVIIENSINDWKFIDGVCQKYTSHRTRGSIYQLIRKAINSDELEPDNLGGNGELIKITQKWIDTRYSSIYKFKLIAIFDSDRNSSSNYNTYPEKIGFFKGKDKIDVVPTDYEYDINDKILWHILYKKKLENYVPLNVMYNCITIISEQQKNDLNDKSNEELDFIEFDKSNIGIGKDKIKDQFPQIFLTNFSYLELEEKCNHHKVNLVSLDGSNEQISELEQILLKIAKII